MTDYPSQYGQSEYSGTYSDPVLSTDAPQYGAEDAHPLPGPGSSGGSDVSAKDKAAQSAEAGKQAASEVAQTAADKAKDVAVETKQQARNVLGQAQDQLREQTQNQHRNLVNNLHSIGDQLQSMSQNSEGSGPATDIVSQAADRAHGVASYLESKQPGELVDELRRFARQRPGAFVLGALVAGVAAGRLTRGVVAAHHDDSGDSSAQSRPQLSGGYEAPETGYAAGGTYEQAGGYGTTGYAGTEPGYGAGGYGTTGGYEQAGGFQQQGGYQQGGYGTAGYGVGPAGGIEP